MTSTEIRQEYLHLRGAIDEATRMLVYHRANELGITPNEYVDQIMELPEAQVVYRKWRGQP